MTDSTNDLINDLIKRLLGLARAEHDDLSVAEEAAAHILALSPQSDRVLVPREPTQTMITAGRQAVGFVADAGSFEIMAIEAYRAAAARRG